jgi:hypothetical protein
MKKYFSGIGTVAFFTCLLISSAPAQDAAPTKAIGPAAPNTRQGKIIDTALSPETRHTLQQAMNSTPAADTTAPAAAK